MSHGVRLGLLTIAVGGSYAAGYHLRDRTGSRPRVGEALYLVGVLLFGASLFLVGQMYHVKAHDPFALLLWAGGATATALVVRSRAIAAAAVLIFTGWVGWEFGLALNDAGATRWAAFPVVAVFYGGALYGLATAAPGADPRALVRGAAAFLESGRGVGLPVAAAGLFVFTFADATDELGFAGDDAGRGSRSSASSAPGRARLRRPPACWLPAAGRATGTRAVCSSSSSATTLIALLAGGDGDVYAVIFNVLFAALALGIIYAGYLSDEPWLVNLGVVLVAVDLVARYFDVFWSALPRSVGMIGAACSCSGSRTCSSASASGCSSGWRRREPAAPDRAPRDRLRPAGGAAGDGRARRGRPRLRRRDQAEGPAGRPARRLPRQLRRPHATRSRGSRCSARPEGRPALRRPRSSQPGRLRRALCLRTTRRGTGREICGRARNDARGGQSVGIEYGIETYYASAERAREIEGAIARGQLYVVVDLDDDGSARIKRLEFGGSATRRRSGRPGSTPRTRG